MAYNLATLFPIGPIYGTLKIVAWQVITNPYPCTVKLVVTSDTAFAADELFAIKGNHYGEAFDNCSTTATGIGESGDDKCGSSTTRPRGWTLISNIPPYGAVTLGLWNSKDVGYAWGEGEVNWQVISCPSTSSESNSSSRSSSSSISSSSYSSSSVSSSSYSTSSSKSSTSTSSESSSSYSTSSHKFPVIGTTYYSDFKDINSINNPLIDNNIEMQFHGYWENNWESNTLDIEKYGYGLKKPLSGHGLIYCNDASKLFSMSQGYVGILLSLPFSIVNGIYLPLKDNSTDLNEYLLWGVNIGRYEPCQPSLHAVLTPIGIEFVIWTSAGKYTIRDTSVNIEANTKVFIECAWNSEEIDNYLIRTVLRINGEDVAIGNPPINNDDISGLKFCVLNTPFLYNNFEGTINKLVIGNTIPASLINDWWSSSSSISSSPSTSTSLSLNSSSSSSYVNNWSSSLSSSSSSYIENWSSSSLSSRSTDSSNSSSGMAWTFTSVDLLGRWNSAVSSTLGSNLAAIRADGFIYTSIDYGSTWTKQNSGSRSWTDMASSSAGNKLAACTSQGGPVGPDYIYTSSNYGVTWTQRTGSGARNWLCIASSADGNKLVAGDYANYIYTSTDAGVSWTPRGNPNNWHGIASSSDGVKLAACVYSNYLVGDYIYTSDNSGVTWTRRTNGVLANYADIASSADGNKLVACVYGGYIYTSDNAGVTWTQRDSYRNWISVCSSADGENLSATEWIGSIYTSSDSGITWTPRGPSRDYSSIASSSDGLRLLACSQYLYIIVGGDVR